MLAKTLCGTTVGVEGLIVSVEVDISQGLPQLTIVGQPDAAAREARERVRSAIKNSGFEYPLKRITVNLAPASIRKAGSHFDLAIALGILAGSGQIPATVIKDGIYLAELALDGSLRPVAGVLPIAFKAQESGISRLTVHKDNLHEALSVPGIGGFAAACLASLVKNQCVGDNCSSIALRSLPGSASSFSLDSEVCFSQIRGLKRQKRGMLIAAAGGHHVLLTGPPGSGKTMLARSLSSILPPLGERESLETSIVHSVASILPQNHGLLVRPPFRSPHHTISLAGMLGSSRGKPGEASLAHNGVLFLDEIPEFRRDVLEALRQPLEERSICLARAGSRMLLPAHFMLVGAANPCACGASEKCRCTPTEVRRYQNRISGPIIDRIDLQMEVARQNWGEAESTNDSPATSSMAESVVEARARQASRQKSLNSDIPFAGIKALCRLGDKEQALFGAAFDRLRLSMRRAAKVLRVARTIADLSGADAVSADHLVEALSYRVIGYGEQE